nr:MAG TPA: hypothetical protein [Caudoviricetes sp.]
MGRVLLPRPRRPPVPSAPIYTQGKFERGVSGPWRP